MWRLAITFEDPRGGARFLSFSSSSRQKFCKMVLNRLAPPPKVSAPGKSWIHHWLDVLFFFFWLSFLLLFIADVHSIAVYFSVFASPICDAEHWRVDKNLLKNHQILTRCLASGARGCERKGEGGLNYYFLTSDLITSKVAPPQPPHPELKLPIESFDIADTLLYTRRLPSWFFWFL